MRNPELMNELTEALKARNRCQDALDQAVGQVARLKADARERREKLAAAEKTLREIEHELLTGESPLPLVAAGQRRSGTVRGDPPSSDSGRWPVVGGQEEKPGGWRATTIEDLLLFDSTEARAIPDDARAYTLRVMDGHRIKTAGELVDGLDEGDFTMNSLLDGLTIKDAGAVCLALACGIPNGRNKPVTMRNRGTGTPPVGGDPSEWAGPAPPAETRPDDGAVGDKMTCEDLGHKRPWTDEELDRLLIHACRHYTSMMQRFWEDGSPSDEEIRIFLADRWPHNRVFVGPDRTRQKHGYTVQGHPSPSFWAGPFRGIGHQATLHGPDLIAAIRRVMGVEPAVPAERRPDGSLSIPPPFETSDAPPPGWRMATESEWILAGPARRHKHFRLVRNPAANGSPIGPKPEPPPKRQGKKAAKATFAGPGKSVGKPADGWDEASLRNAAEDLNIDPLMLCICGECGSARDKSTEAGLTACPACGCEGWGAVTLDSGVLVAHPAPPAKKPVRKRKEAAGV